MRRYCVCDNQEEDSEWHAVSLGKTQRKFQEGRYNKVNFSPSVRVLGLWKMSKPPAFKSKTSMDMYQTLPGTVESKEAEGNRRMDPNEPLVGELTRERVCSMQSNVEMEDVSDKPWVMNAPAVPKHPVYSGTTTREKREFIQQYNQYYHTLLSYETLQNKPFVMPVAACIDPWVKFGKEQDFAKKPSGCQSMGGTRITSFPEVQR